MTDEERDFVKSRLKSLFKEKWTSQGKTLQDFVVQLELMGENADKSKVSRWANGKTLPHRESIDNICKVLAVTIDDILPVSSYEERYQYSSMYQNDVAKWNIDVATKSFGLNLSLIYGLKQLIDFGSEFPIFAPLECVLTNDPEKDNSYSFIYMRADPLQAAKQGQQMDFFQICNDGKTLNLSPMDMKFLSKVQKSIIDIVRKLFADHKEELQNSVNEASKLCKDFFQPDGKIRIGEEPLSLEDKQEIDSSGMYTAEEWKIIPNLPDNLEYPVAFRPPVDFVLRRKKKGEKRNG